MANFGTIAIVNQSDSLVRINVASGHSMGDISSAWGALPAGGQNYRDFGPGLCGTIDTDTKPAGQGFLVLTASAFVPPAAGQSVPYPAPPPLSSVSAHHLCASLAAVASVIAIISGSGGRLDPIELHVEEG